MVPRQKACSCVFDFRGIDTADLSENPLRQRNHSMLPRQPSFLRHFKRFYHSHPLGFFPHPASSWDRPPSNYISIPYVIEQTVLPPPSRLTSGPIGKDIRYLLTT